jgi:Na+/H+-dicarboxylate symporter
MGRSMTNVLGNALSTAAIDKFESNKDIPEKITSITQ